MSYRCGVCYTTVPDGTPRLIHRVMRDRVKPNGSTCRETAAEVPACAECHRRLSNGVLSLAELRKTFAPTRESLAAPEYVPGEPQRPVPSSGTLVIPELGSAVAGAVQDLTPTLPIGMLYSLFQRYGAVSYWDARFADMSAEDVANEVAQHWHLRRLWGKLHDLVPTARKRKVARPQPQRAAVKRPPIAVEEAAVATGKMPRRPKQK